MGASDFMFLRNIVYVRRHAFTRYDASVYRLPQRAFICHQFILKYKRSDIAKRRGILCKMHYMAVYLLIESNIHL